MEKNSLEYFIIVSIVYYFLEIRNGVICYVMLSII